jgi:FkbM family methyltransferase
MNRAFQRLLAAGMCAPGVRQVVRFLARNKLLPRGLWVRVPVTGPVAFEAEGLRLTYQSTLMDQLGRILFYSGSSAYEPEILRVLPPLARQARGVIDVGAHTGLFTLLALAANPQAQAVAIEPVLNNAVAVQGNLAANRCGSRCVLVAAAAGAEVGVLPFDRGAADVPMTAQITTRAGDGSGERVPAVTVDLVAPWLPAVDLIKIDVEGFEDLVLRGAQATLEQHRPALVVECLPGSKIETFAPLWERLGYRRFHLLPDGPRPLGRIEPSPTDATWNYLLTTCPDVVPEQRPHG